MSDNKFSIGKLLIENRESRNDFWYWLRADKPTSRSDANKFFLGAIIDYQINAEKAWENSRRFSEEIIKDPENLWHKITNITFEEWMSKKKEYSLHWLNKAHERVWKIAQRIVRYYDGDTRNIWQNQTAGEIISRLEDLHVGEQISRMIIIH